MQLFALSFEHSERKKNESHSLRVSEIIDSQECGYLNAKKNPVSANHSAVKC